MPVPTSIKDINTEKIRAFMKQKKETSKSEIARGTGLSFPTVTRILDDLCTSGEIIDHGQGISTGGRCASIYSLNSTFSLCLLIQIEGIKVIWAVKDLSGNIVTQDEFPHKSSLLEQLDHLIQKLEAAYSQLKVIVIGIAAMVKEGTVEETIGFTNLKGIDLLLHFKNVTSLPVQVHNDMNLIALGHWYQSRQKPKSSVCIYLGECGMGAGIILDGEVWCGTEGFAGELSYLPFFEHSPFQTEDHFNLMNAVEYYARLIQIYTVILNPEQIILYQNPYIREKIEEIRKKCRKYLPGNVIPHIEVSQEYQSDYENGLFAKAKKMMV